MKVIAQTKYQDNSYNKRNKQKSNLSNSW